VAEKCSIHELTTKVPTEIATTLSNRYSHIRSAVWAESHTRLAAKSARHISMEAAAKSVDYELHSESGENHAG
jgi:hypothetical protein